MIAINIGQTFLNAYNEKFNKTFTAKEFFKKELWELFYNHKKYMMWITNSSFNPGNHLGDISEEGRKMKLDSFVDSISQKKLDEKNVIGYSVVDIAGTTSGQITNMNLPIQEDEAYLSWIGAGFGIEVGGVAMFIDNKHLLLDIFEGWNLYRKFLNDFPQFEKGNQIERWNSQWLSHRYNKRKYNPQDPTALFNPTEAKENKMVIASLPWIKIIEAIARNFPNLLVTTYIYKLGFNTPNTTIGFIEVLLPQINYTFNLYTKYFGTTDIDQIDKFFGTELGFSNACQMGVIGISALEPKSFRNCLKEGVIPKYNDSAEEKRINFNTYLIWLMAMLNNEELWVKSREFAQLLINYIAGSEQARTNRQSAVKSLLESTKKDKFLENLIPILNGIKSDKCDEIGKEIHFMSGGDFPYFATLLRFQYASLNNLKQ
jgi:hypothetical protein